ncbi:MAG TPA: hypothetical protein VNT77_08395 [Allosphingosinicella sp.]|nr:hypothetical protein [Allosphingosinicella sp.]
MKSITSPAGRRARQLVPGITAQAITVSAVAPGSMPVDDIKLFTMTLAGGLVFFGTFFS